MSTNQHNVDIVINETHPQGVVYHAGTADVFPGVAGMSIQLHPDGIPTAQLSLLEIGLDLKEVKARAGVRVGGRDFVLVDPDTIMYQDMRSDEVLVMRGQAKPAAAALTAHLIKAGVLVDNKHSETIQAIQEFYKTVVD